MQDFDHELTELRDLLERADLLSGWQGWSYSLGGHRAVEMSIRLAIRSDAHARPTGAVFDTAAVELHMEVNDGCSLDDVRSCSAQVVVDGLTADGEDLRFALHFDRHNEAQQCIELHARYHWQVGGHRLDGVNINGLLVLEGPRFPSHPLDPTLLVDFVLSHFHGEKRTELIMKPAFVRYRRLLASSQTRYVAPFFAQISNAILAEPFVGTGLWPALTSADN